MAETDSPRPPAGWYTDQEDPSRQRYWDGGRWTDARRETPAESAPPPGAPPAAGATGREGNGFAVTALVCGIVGAVFGLVPLTYLIALALGTVALVFGVLGRRRVKRNPQVGRKGMATAGTVLGVIALGLGVIGAVVVDEAINDIDGAVDELDTSLECIDQATTPAQIDRC